MTSLDQASHAISTLQENGVETKSFYKLVAEFYFTALSVARKTGQIPAVSWPNGQQFNSVQQLSQANERAWRDYLARDNTANRDQVITERIMHGRTWSVV